MGWPQYLIMGMAAFTVLWNISVNGSEGFLTALAVGFGQWVLYMGDFYA